MVQGFFLDEDGNEISYEDHILQTVKKDYAEATKFMDGFHRECQDYSRSYNNFYDYESLKDKERFPVPFLREQIDSFVADAMDKLYYKNKPCSIVPREESDKEDADAKQSYVDWLDQEDHIYLKTRQWMKDAAEYGVAIAQVDYCKEACTEVIEVDEPIEISDGFGGMQALRDENGYPVTQKVRQLQTTVTYNGAKTRRIDPENLFITQDKSEMGDDFPVMIRSWQPLSYFEGLKYEETVGENGEPGTKGYFFNIDKLKSRSKGSATSGEKQTDEKVRHAKFTPNPSTAKKNFEYVEWQAMVYKKMLYAALGRPEEEVNAIPEGEKCRAIVGFVDKEVLVRLGQATFSGDSCNIVCGGIDLAENSPIGIGFGQKLRAIHKQMQVYMGMHESNLKQSVNSGWAFNQNKLSAGQGKLNVNAPGWVVQFDDDPAKCVQRLSPPIISQDITRAMALLTEMGKGVIGRRNISQGAGDPMAETLGESQIVAMQGAQQTKDYLRTFEETFIQPLYELRNAINVEHVDQDFVIRVIGEQGIVWRTVLSGQVRANVDFRCESSSRETNRLVITQQLMQMIQVAPLAIQAGFVVRLDMLLKELLEQGFSWSSDKTKEILPTVELNHQEYLQLQAMQTMRTAQMGAQQGEPGSKSPSPNQELPSPNSEREAVISNQARNQTPVGAL